MKKFTLFFLFVTFAFPIVNLACNCVYIQSFCEGIRSADGSVYVDVIVEGKLTESLSNGRKSFTVDQVVYGELNEVDIIISPDLCTAEFEHLEEDKEYLFALLVGANSIYPIPCAWSFLEIDNGILKGNIAPGLSSMDYDEFVVLEDCADDTVFIPREGKLNVFPNLTKDRLKIEYVDSNVPLQQLKLRVYDMIGRELLFYNKEEIFPGEIWEISINDFAAGMYLFQLSAIDQEEVFKIVKQ